MTLQQLFDVALQHHQSGRLHEAEPIYRQILQQQPNHADALHFLGVVAHQVGQNEIALGLINRAIALKPEYAEAHSNLGIALWEKGQLEEAIAAYRKAITLKPDYADAHYNLGTALKDKGQLEDAIDVYRQALVLKNDFPVAHSSLILVMNYQPDCDAPAIAGEHRCWNRHHAEPLKQFIRPHTNDRNPDRRLRIGYVSPDFREHSVGRFLLPLLVHHDKNHVEVLVYAQVPVPDALTEQLRSHVDGWRNIVGVSDEQVAQLIREDQIDILVDLAMHTAHNRLLIFAYKPAPVQVTYLAYVGSTGLDTMDYRLSDPYLDPVGMDESIYSEQTIRLPESYWCYQPLVDLPLSPPPVLDKGHITFGCLNNFCKVNDRVLALWARVLKSVPESHLLLHALEGSHRQRTLDHLEQKGIDPRRVRFVGMVPQADYLRLYRQIDIALDTFPYGGGTTTCDALWMGVPVVSLIGKTAVGRAGLSILSNVGLPELVAKTEEEYVQKAIALAHDLPRLKDLRRNMRQMMRRSPLMDAPRFACNVEAAYRKMWMEWCEKQPATC